MLAIVRSLLVVVCKRTHTVPMRHELCKFFRSDPLGLLRSGRTFSPQLRASSIAPPGRGVRGSDAFFSDQSSASPPAPDTPSGMDREWIGKTSWRPCGSPRVGVWADSGLRPKKRPHRIAPNGHGGTPPTQSAPENRRFGARQRGPRRKPRTPWSPRRE